MSDLDRDHPNGEVEAAFHNRLRACTNCPRLRWPNAPFLVNRDVGAALCMVLLALVQLIDGTRPRGWTEASQRSRRPARDDDDDEASSDSSSEDIRLLDLLSTDDDGGSDQGDATSSSDIALLDLLSASDDYAPAPVARRSSRRHAADSSRVAELVADDAAAAPVARRSRRHANPVADSGVEPVADAPTAELRRSSRLAGVPVAPARRGRKRKANDGSARAPLAVAAKQRRVPAGQRRPGAESSGVSRRRQQRKRKQDQPAVDDNSELRKRARRTSEQRRAPPVDAPQRGRKRRHSTAAGRRRSRRGAVAAAQQSRQQSTLVPLSAEPPAATRPIQRRFAVAHRRGGRQPPSARVAGDEFEFETSV